MSNIIDIPVRTHENFGDSLARLIAIVDKINCCQEEKILLNFTHAKMLNPFFLGGLVAVVNNLVAGGKIFELNHDDNSSIRTYLQTIWFPDGFTATPGYEDNYLQQLEKYSTKTYIPITKFKTAASPSITPIKERVLSAVLQLLKNQLNFSGSEIEPLHYFLSELTDNISEHSKTEEGYVFAQYYPSSNYIDVCICDSGCGILQSYVNNPKFHTDSEVEAVQFAISGKSTKDRNESRGFGISTTRNMLVNGLRGKLFIWSGNTTFTQAVNVETVASIGGNAYFQGTFIALRLPTIVPGSFSFYKFIER